MCPVVVCTHLQCQLDCSQGIHYNWYLFCVTESEPLGGIFAVCLARCDMCKQLQFPLKHTKSGVIGELALHDLFDLSK